MKKPNFWISLIFGTVFSIIFVAAYIGATLIQNLFGAIIGLGVLVLTFGTVVGLIIHIIRSLKWAIGKEDYKPRESVRRYK